MAVARSLYSESRLRIEAFAPALVAFAVLTSIGLADGGLFPRAWRLATLALVALAGAALLTRARVALGRLEWCTLALLAAFTGWIALSGFWSGSSSDSLLQAERSVVYVVGLLAVLVIAERDSLPQLLAGTVAGITTVAAYGLATYRFASPRLDPVEGKLLYQPLGYANALGIFAAIAILLSIGLALATPRPAARLVALLPLAVLVPTLSLTSARGAWIALVVGLAFLLRFGRRIPVRVAALVTALAVIGVGAVLVASGGAGTLSRFAGDNRIHYWRVAWQDYQAHPALGSGAGTYGDYWLRHRPTPSFTRAAHSLYLQALAELGPVGVLLVVAALGLPLLALRGRRDPYVAAAGAGYVAFLLHAGIDWDWELPAVTLAGLVCGAGLLVSRRREDGSALSLRVRAALLAPALVLGVVAFVRLGSGPTFPFGH